ncbi:MAG: endolytic transglycosylase MltG [Acidobacteriaceae bacterium]
MRRLILLLILLVVIAGAYVLLMPAGSRRETFIEITPGMGAEAIGRQLEQHGVVRSRFAFDAVRLLKRGTLKAGEYRFDHPATVFDVYDRLRRGDVYFRAVTIPEGYNLFDVAAAVEAAQLGTKEEFLLAARREVTLITDLDPRATSLEGYLFPDTYRFQRLDTPATMLHAMVKRFRGEAAQLGLHGNYHDTVTMASLVEKETPVGSDRPLVASVLANRMKQGIPLMTDPTVIYAAMLENRYRGTIYQSDLHSKSDYNTYQHAGLPPGPICNPGVASLQAAMHPATTNYLYFVADAAAAGHSRFAATLEEHQRNVAAYRRAQRTGGTTQATP